MSVSTARCSSTACTYRRVQVDEDGTGDVFAAASLGEEGLVGTSLAKLLRIGVGTTIREQAVLEEVAGGYRVSSRRPRLESHAAARSRTAPRRCCPAGFQLGRCEGGKSVEGHVSSGRVWLWPRPDGRKRRAGRKGLRAAGAARRLGARMHGSGGAMQVYIPLLAWWMGCCVVQAVKRDVRVSRRTRWR